MNGISGDNKITTIKSGRNTTGDGGDSVYFNGSYEACVLQEILPLTDDQELGRRAGEEQLMGGTLTRDRIIGILEEAEDEEESPEQRELEQSQTINELIFNEELESSSTYVVLPCVPFGSAEEETEMLMQNITSRCVKVQELELEDGSVYTG